ncbi:MAG TPA: primosomal protein N', partial [Hyphomicrobiaceae bacterium]|nr:primosomal protein N' [Hyphomicrobiaceae bacterium]
MIVPFGSQSRIGIIWDAPAGLQKPVDPKKLKVIDGLVEVPPLPVQSLRFAEWIAKYTLAPLGMVARMMMGARAAFEPEKPRSGVQIVPGAALPPRMTPARTKAVEIAGDGLVRVKSELAREAGCTSGVVDGLVQAGVLVEVTIPERVYPTPDPTHVAVDFSDEQGVAVHGLRAAVEARNFSATLLDGVTGSGKTEVYFEAVAAALAQGRQVLIMLPEIALTSQFISRFEARFGCLPVEWHSALSPAERGRIWKAVAQGKVRCVIGARSGLFLPYPDLGMIVVDEEHDGGFKQDDRVHYQARDMAVVRGSLGGFPVVLASATPSIESHVNAITGRYRHAVLPGRFSGIELPEIEAIDLRSAPPEQGKWLSPKLVAAVTETLADGRQTLLFLNRRGYAPLTLCRSCGSRIECPQC